MTVATVQVGDLEIAYETFGSSDDPALLLVMGLATQMLGWDEEFCDLLAGSGFHVVRFDNRDVGLSTHLYDAGVPDLTPAFLGESITAPYLLADMAGDTVGLLDALGIGRAHVVGASMGGMIAQEVAVRHPDRVLSLTSIMSTPSTREGRSTPEAQAALMAPPPANAEEAAARTVAAFRVVGSPAYPLDEPRVAARARLAFTRANDPGGVARQFAAILASPDRTPGLRQLSLPTLVVHGEDDPLVGVDGGVATADAVPGARLVTISGMGHDLPAPLWPQLVEEIVANAGRVDVVG